MVLSNVFFAQDILKIPATRTKPAINCPMEGNPKEGSKKKFYEGKNQLKNRYHLPLVNNFDKSVTLEKMAGDGEPDINKFNEKKAGTIEGYIVYVSPSGWSETCNCGTILSDYTDIHIEIAENPDEEKGGRTVVVELTPRLRLLNGKKWDRKELNKLWKQKIPVRISGWLFYDEEHEPQARNVVGEDCEKFNNRRQTCWEIHPITDIKTLEDATPITLIGPESLSQLSNDSTEKNVIDKESSDDRQKKVVDITPPTKTQQSYELLKIILSFIGTIIWPITFLIIIFLFKREIQKFLVRAKKLGLPGGFSLEVIEEDIIQAKELSVEVNAERKPEVQKLIDEAGPSFESEANKRMIEVGLTPSPSGLDLNYYRRIADEDPRLALIGLRADLETMLKNLAKGFNVSISNKESPTKITSKLLDKGAITSRQYQFINTLFRICNSAAHGALISKEQALEVLDIGEVLVKDYIAWLNWGFK